MNIVMIINNLGAGGAERQLMYSAEIYKNAGHNVTVVTYRSGDFYQSELNAAGINTVCLNCSSKLKAIIKTRKALLRLKADYVFAFLRSPILCACAASLLKKKWKLLTRLGSANPHMFASRFGKLISLLIRVADYIICNSENEMSYWNKYAHVPAEKIKLIYNYIKKQNPGVEYIPKKDGHLNIVVAASYSDVKNIKGVLAALASMTEEQRRGLHIDWYGQKEIAIGDTSVYDDAVRFIKEKMLGDTITLCGLTKNIAEKMYMADMVGLFSHFEGLPNAICEGMMLGKPIIMSRVSDYHVIIRDNGFLCDASDVSSIKKTFIDAVSLSASDIIKMGRKSKQIAAELFDDNRVSQMWMTLIV